MWEYEALFDKIDPGSKVILYGAGKVGQLFYRQIETTHYCEIVLWVSKDAEQHEAVSEIREMVGTQFDKIVVAVESGKIAEEIKKDLLSMGIDAGRIVWRNPRMERMNEI